MLHRWVSIRNRGDAYLVPLLEHKNADFVLGWSKNLRKIAHSDTKTPFLYSKSPKMGVPKSKSAQKCHFCARGWLPRAQQRPPELSTTRHEPCGVHLAAVRQATDCRNLPRNLPRACRRAYYREQAATQPAAKTYLPLILPCIPPWRYRRGATAKNYRRVLPPRNYPRATYLPGILPRDGSRAQWAGDSDVGANDKGAGDNPGDGVDAH